MCEQIVNKTALIQISLIKYQVNKTPARLPGQTCLDQFMILFFVWCFIGMFTRFNVISLAKYFNRTCSFPGIKYVLKSFREKLLKCLHIATTYIGGDL